MEFSNVETSTGGHPVDMTDLLLLRDQIQSFEKIHQIEILRMLHTNGAILSFNKNGSLINLMDVDPLLLQQMKKYVEYVYTQEDALSKNEKEKEFIKSNYFSMDKEEKSKK